MEQPIKRVWITGAAGLIGSHLAETARIWAPGWTALPISRAEVDLCDSAAVERIFHETKPDAVIHCAALSRSPVCQSDPGLARMLNVQVTQFLSDLAAEIPFIFFSTDLVFDGKKGNYVETDEVNPLSVYAETKVAAELSVMLNPRHTIIRTSLNFGVSPSGDRAFNEELRAAWKAGRVLNLFVDEFRSPIPVQATARAVWELLQTGKSGLFHLAGSERMSRYEIGMLLAERCAELSPRFEKGSLHEYKGAPRPPDTSMNCDKIQSLLKFKLPGMTRWLADRPLESI